MVEDDDEVFGPKVGGSEVTPPPAGSELPPGRLAELQRQLREGTARRQRRMAMLGKGG
jgi:hypothetical protein